MPIPGNAAITTERLQVLAGLLAAPVAESMEALWELAVPHRWLRPAVAELKGLPLDQWQAEHTGLFINGYPNTPCPPFASVYLNGQMGGPVQGELAAFYRALGVGSDGMPADYLGTLLECAALLQRQGDGGDSRHRLWEEFLRPWLPRFAADLNEHARLALYRALAAQLAGLCAMDGP